MYFDPNVKHYSFLYKKQSYPSGTRLIFNGKCYLNGREVTLNNKEVTWLYNQKSYSYFTDGIETYTSDRWYFVDKVVNIVENIPVASQIEEKSVFYWTDEMIIKTMWYVVIMAVGTLFYARIFIWIFATIIWYNSTFKNN